MGETLFVTGAAGHVGRRFLALVPPGRYSRVRCLVRHPLASDASPGEQVAGDLLNPASYAHALEGCGTVVHLAAVTGRRGREDYFRINREGTRVLIEACERAGVRNFLHVSTIAVKYPDLSRYYYAQAKRDAEEIVRAGRLRHAIVRPTMIFGQDAPVLTNLTKLALAPVIPVFGSGAAKVQPIYVDDLARLMLAIIENDDFRGQVVEAGGRDVVCIEDLLVRIRLARTGKRGRRVHLPMRLVEPALIVAETVLGPLVPVTAGQLKALTMDGVANDPPAGRGLDEMLALSFAGQGSGQLRRECITYSRYLMGQDPSPYVISKYEEFHRQHPEDAASGFDAFLVRIAARRPLFARLADAYASRFYRGSALRRKLVLLLGILETAAPSAAHLDSPGARSRIGALAGMAFAAARYALALAASVFVFAPFHLALGAWRTE